MVKKRGNWVYAAVMHDGTVLKEPYPFTVKQAHCANLIIEHDPEAMSLTITKNRYAGCTIQGTSWALTLDQGQLPQVMADRAIEAHADFACPINHLKTV